jgi:hypothetical protein
MMAGTKPGHDPHLLTCKTVHYYKASECGSSRIARPPVRTVACYSLWLGQPQPPPLGDLPIGAINRGRSIRWQHRQQFPQRPRQPLGRRIL